MNQPNSLPLQDKELPSGILLINKPKGKTSFSLVGVLRRLLKVKKIGHAGTLDPFATGVMVLLVGKQYTRLSDKFLCAEKEYITTLHLGIETDSYDSEGQVLKESSLIPTQHALEECLKSFQGTIQQVPPMFSAKKIDGKKLYELARKGVSIEREPVNVTVDIKLLSYQYPFIELHVKCSKGTYIRSIGHDIGQQLGCGAFLCALQRVRSGNFCLADCIEGAELFDPACNVAKLEASLIKNTDPWLVHENHS